MTNKRKTQRGGVMTQQGMIPHIRDIDGHHYPVVTFYRGGVASAEDWPEVVYHAGELVYAKPGGLFCNERFEHVPPLPVVRQISRR